jgi:uncharacterized protein involved in exopolysaccharide biosynthesis
MDIQLTPRNVAYVVFKRRRAAFRFFAFCVAVNLLYIWVTPPKYESDAQVMVKVNFNNPDLARPDFGSTGGNSGGGGQTTTMQVSEDIIKSLIVSYKSLATSQDIERAIVRKMTIDTLYPTLKDSFMVRHFFNGTLEDKAVEKLDNDLAVSQLKESNILEIAVFNRDPHVAQQTEQALLSDFIGLQQSVFRAPATSFVEGQLDAARAHAQSVSEDLRKFKVAHQLSEIPDERTQLLTERTNIAGNLDSARSALGSALAHKQALEQSLHEFETHATMSSGTDAMSRQLDDAQARLSAQIERYNAARTSYPADNPFVKNAEIAVADARKRLSEIQKEIDQTVRGGASPVYQALETDMLRASADVSGAEAQVAAISKDLDGINARLLELDRLEGQLQQLESQVQVAQDNLTTQLQRVEESRISTDLNKSQITSVAVVEQPTLGYKVARPRWKLSTALSLFLGLFGGLAFAFMRESFSETFGLPEQLEQSVRVPVLTTLTLIRS